MSNVYFVSDCHFSHRNILKFEPIRIDFVAKFMSEHGSRKTFEEAREFLMNCIETGENVETMLYWHDEAIIAAWNSRVKDDDVVWFLGDFGFKDTKKMQEIGRRLKGHKRMIMGNHDREKPEFYYTCGFEFVSPYPVILKRHFILSHAPAFINYVFDEDGELMPVRVALGDMFNIYGHVHSHSDFATLDKDSACVCVERINFTPTILHVFDSYVEGDAGNPAKARRK